MNRLVNAAVVVLLILLGILLIVPFLARLREPADRAHCQNNLRLLGVAVQTYHDGHKAYPRATLPHKALPPEKRLSWVVALLPEAGLERLAKQFDPDKAWDADENQPAASTAIPRLLCPSNPNRGEADAPRLTHYAGLTGLGVQAGQLPRGDPKAGFFGHERAITRDDVKHGDGLGNTFVAGESLAEVGPWAAGGDATARGLDWQRQPYIGPSSRFGGPHFTDPNQRSTSLQSGANFLFADGSVRFFSEATAPRVLEALTTIAGGEREDEF